LFYITKTGEIFSSQTLCEIFMHNVLVDIIIKIFTDLTKYIRMKQPISLVLSGGAARGIAHIGVIEEIEKQGFEIKSIAGNSMGAFIAAVYAMGKLQEFKNWIITMDKKDVFMLFDFTLSSHGFIKGDKVFNKMKTFILDINIEDIKIPFAAVAADILNMKEVVFTKGSIYKAIRASIAIPTVFTPVKSGNAILVDGGVVNPIPLNRVSRTKGDILVAVYVNADVPLQKPQILKKKYDKYNSGYKIKIEEFRNKLHEILPKNNDDKFNYFKLLNKSASLLTHSLSIMCIDKYKPDLLINISRDACGIFDFFKAEELIEIGRFAAKNSIINYKTKAL